MNLKEEILKAATLSISAHNVQPFRFRFLSETEIDIYFDANRLLRVGDPNNKDLRQSLGAMIEALHVGLSKIGYGVSLQNYEADAIPGKPFAKIKLHKVSQPDPLTDFLTERFSYRGKFPKKSTAEFSSIPGERFALEFLTEKSTISEVAKLFDNVNHHFMSLPGYVEELYSWMRFSPEHSRWAFDGLNAEAMSLSGIETWGASVILKSNVFRMLNKMGVAKTLLSEAGQIQSASALAVILCDENDDVSKGRAFMRAWLTLTSKGLYGAPLSLLTDDPAALDVIRSFLKVQNKPIVNILRVGPLPENFKRPASARVPWQELEWRP